MKKLTKIELQKLKKLCDEIEFIVWKTHGWKHLNGGFATCEVKEYNEDDIDLELKEGVESDVENRVYTSILNVNRKTMKVDE